MEWIVSLSRFFNENHLVIWWIAVLLGTWTLMAEVYRFVHFLYAKLIRKRKNFKQTYGEGKWALVTGSSEGIGTAFAMGLAKEGFSIILTARTGQKLKVVQQDIHKMYPQIQVRYIVVDHIRTCDRTDIESTWYKDNKLNELDIRILVNNAGIDFLDKFNDLSIKDIIRMIEINSFNVISLQHLFLEKWVKQQSEQAKEAKSLRHLIINVSSLCAELPVSYFSAYNATKIYVDRLTKASALQYPKVDFMALRPSEVSTRMGGFKKDLFTIEPEQCVEPLLDDIGYQTVSHGHTKHAIQSWLYSIIPLWLFNLVWEGVFQKEFKEARRNFEKSLKAKPQ